MEPPVGHVVHLESVLGATPPALLRLSRRMGGAAKVVVGLLLLAGTAAAAAGKRMLWTTETPGWWFSLLFTVMLGGLALGAWVVYLDSFRTAAQARRAEAAWAAGRGTVVPEAARVVDRKVGLTDTGRVSTFDLVVELAGGRAAATWHQGGDGLLQPQVPGIGAAARVWRVDGALVVEVVDPTVVVGDPV